MELRYFGLIAFIVILSFVVSGTTARPLSGSTSEVSVFATEDVKVDPSSKENVVIPKSSHVDLNIPKREVTAADKPTGVNLVDTDVTHEERMLADASDYEDPSGNENPRHEP